MKNDLKLHIQTSNGIYRCFRMTLNFGQSQEEIALAIGFEVTNGRSVSDISVAYMYIFFVHVNVRHVC